MATAVGIDLGTTNSVIAATEAGQPTVIPNAEGASDRLDQPPGAPRGHDSDDVIDAEFTTHG
jgi:molecular chaperone DnaK (HSP70)